MSVNENLEVPKAPVMMVTTRDFRLSSLSGLVVNFKANEPTLVWPQCFLDAVGIGATLAEEQPEQEEAPEKRTVDPSVAEAARLEEEAKITYTEQAIVILLQRGDSTDFKADGYPKAPKVVAEMSPEAPRPSASEIQTIFDDMREDVKFAEFFDS